MRNRDINTLDALVVALCLDYERRAAAIQHETAVCRTDTEYRYLNYKIYEAVSEISGEEFALTYIKEIGREVGYANSDIDNVSESTYKNFKRMMKDNIAKKLHLKN